MSVVKTKWYYELLNKEADTTLSLSPIAVFLIVDLR